MTTTGWRVDKQITRVALIPTSFRNTIITGACLPWEILAEIFLYCARTDYHESSDEVGVPQWVNVSYVCSRWRCVALGCPTLWSYLFIASPRWTDALLSRSKEVPLWVCVDFTPSNRAMAVKFMKQVTLHSERFRECRLDLDSEGSRFVLPMLSSRSAPLLHTLAVTYKQPSLYSIRLVVPEDAGPTVEMDEDPNSPRTFFNGDTPALRELYLNDYFLTCCSPTLGGLTVLQLCDLDVSVQPTMAELKVMLSRMPDLARLHLACAIRDGSDDPARLEAEKVQLPRLSHLIIAERFPTAVHFMSSIDIPATTRVRLGCHLEVIPSENDYAPFLAIISGILGNSENEATSVAPIRTMVMDGMPEQISFTFSKSERDCRRQDCNSSFFEDCDCDVPLKLVIACSSRNRDWDNLIVNICRSEPLAGLKNLILDCCLTPAMLWSDVFWNLQELRYLKLVKGDLTDISTVFSLSPLPLSENADTPTDPDTTLPFAPALEELCLDGARIPRGYRCRGDRSVHACYMTPFFNGLARRKAAGYKLKRLSINQCFSFSQREVTCLAKEVSHVFVHRFAMLLPDEEYCEDCEEVEEELEELDSDELSDDDSIVRVNPW